MVWSANAKNQQRKQPTHTHTKYSMPLLFYHAEEVTALLLNLTLSKCYIICCERTRGEMCLGWIDARGGK